jgi:hypothetical protein
MDFWKVALRPNGATSEVEKRFVMHVPDSKLTESI